MKKENSPCRILGLGEIEFNFTLNLNDVIINKLKLDLDTINNLEQLIIHEEIKNSIVISSKNNLINLLLFVNKSSSSKVCAEFVCLNYLSLPDEFSFLKDKMKMEFEENFLYLVEAEVNNTLKRFPKIDVMLNNVFYKTFDLKDGYTEKLNNYDMKKEKVKDLYIDVLGGSNKYKRKYTEKEDSELPSLIIQGDSNKHIDNILIYSDKERYDEETPDEIGTFNNLLNINYDFHKCDYLFIDINEFYKKNSVINSSVKNIYEFIESKNLSNKSKVTIILIFPFDSKTVNDNENLIKLILISDIIIYERSEAMKFCKSLGYKVEEKNFELRYVLMEELNNCRVNRTEKHSLFFDNLKKLLVLTQNTKTGGIPFNVEYIFDRSKNNTKAFLGDHYEMLLYIFIGAFFSRFILEKSFDSCFNTGIMVFNKILHILVNSNTIPSDPNYFITDKRTSNTPSELSKQYNLSKKNTMVLKKETGFNLDCLNLVSNKKNNYNPLLDNNLAHYFSSSVVRKHLNKMGFIDREGKIIEERTVKEIVNKSISPNSFKLQDYSKQLDKYTKTGNGTLIPSSQLLPIIQLPEKDNVYQQKIVNRNNFLEEKAKIKKRKFLSSTKFKTLKPISDTLYARLGHSSTNNLLNAEQECSEIKEKDSNSEKINWKNNQKFDVHDSVRKVSTSNRFLIKELDKKRSLCKTANSNKNEINIQKPNKNKEIESKFSQAFSKDTMKFQGSTVFNNHKQISDCDRESSIEKKKNVFKDYKFFDNKFKLNRDKYLEGSLRLLEIYNQELGMNPILSGPIPKHIKIVSDSQMKNSSINTPKTSLQNGYMNINFIKESSISKLEGIDDTNDQDKLKKEFSIQTIGNDNKSYYFEDQNTDNKSVKKQELVDKVNEGVVETLNNKIDSKFMKENKIEVESITDSIQIE
jgi:hypothetical protein